MRTSDVQGFWMRRAFIGWWCGPILADGTEPRHWRPTLRLVRRDRDLAFVASREGRVEQ